MSRVNRMITVALMVVLSLTVLAGCGGGKKAATESKPKVKLTIAAAASLQDALDQIKTDYTRAHPDVQIACNYASSGTLQQQIEQGAPADLFISAGKSQMDALAQKKLLIESTRKNLLGNDLVLIAGKDSKITGFQDLADSAVTKISIGVPESVPAGKYAKETLTNLKLWDSVKGKMVLAKDVRQVLNYVETGNVAAGLVYRSDVTGAKNVKIVAVAPLTAHSPIVYPVAVIKASKFQQAAGAFEDYLRSDRAAAIFTKYGFKTTK